jgi:hypothetical protein
MPERHSIARRRTIASMLRPPVSATRVAALLLVPAAATAALSGCSVADRVQDALRGPVATYDETYDDLPDFSALEPGECYRDPWNEPSGVVPTVPCATAHDYEVVARIPLGGLDDAYPGDARASKAAQQGCIAALEEYVGVDYLDSRFDVAVDSPDAYTWDDDGRRHTVCSIFDWDYAPLTGSAAGTGE